MFAYVYGLIAVIVISSSWSNASERDYITDDLHLLLASPSVLESDSTILFVHNYFLVPYRYETMTISLLHSASIPSGLNTDCICRIDDSPPFTCYITNGYYGSHNVSADEKFLDLDFWPPLSFDLVYSQLLKGDSFAVRFESSSGVVYTSLFSLDGLDSVSAEAGIDVDYYLNLELPPELNSYGIKSRSGFPWIDIALWYDGTANLHYVGEKYHDADFDGSWVFRNDSVFLDFSSVWSDTLETIFAVSPSFRLRPNSLIPNSVGIISFPKPQIHGNLFAGELLCKWYSPCRSNRIVDEP